MLDGFRYLSGNRVVLMSFVVDVFLWIALTFLAIGGAADAVHGAAAAAVGTAMAAAGGGVLVVIVVGMAVLAVPAFLRYRV